MNSFIKLNNISFILPNGEKLFDNVNCTFSSEEKVALIGDNGSGKSTLLKMIVGEIKEATGTVSRSGSFLYIPQHISEVKGTIAEVLEISDIINALHQIEAGNSEYKLFEIISNNWDIEEKNHEVLKKLDIDKPLSTNFQNLSGGEKEKIMLAKCLMSKANFIILDEPTNNLDEETKQIIYNFIVSYKKGMIIVSHDRTLLEKISKIYELTKHGIETYGGNYNFYEAKKNHDKEILEQQKSFLNNEKKKLVQMKNKIQEQQMKIAKNGRKSIENKKYSKVVANSLVGSSDISASKKNNKLDQKIQKNINELYNVGVKLISETIKIPIPDKPFIRNKLLEVNNISFGYSEKLILNKISFVLSGDDRLQIIGKNGCGKSTLIKLIMGDLNPHTGSINLNGHAVYLDQELSLLSREKSILENMLDFNSGINIQEAHAILANFKFRNLYADKKISCLSGGEILRASLAVILGTQKQPDLIVLDEPTNNLDIQSIKVLEEALKQYQGAIIIVSHDNYFIQQIGITKKIILERS